MVKAIIVLILLNLMVGAHTYFFSEASGEDELPLTEPDIPSIVLLPDKPGGLFQSSRAAIQSSCYSLGPFNSERAAQLVTGKIRGYGLAATMRSIRSMETMNYLVYIPPVASVEAAEELIKDISKHNVQDHHVVKDGPYTNAVSLGFFTRLEHAKRHAEYVRYLGYDARYTEQKSPLEVFWIDFDEPFGNNTPVMIWSENIDPSSEVQKIPRSCS